MAKILIVDDNDFVRSFCRDVLEEAGHEIDEAVNGKEALEKYKNGFDCILLDVIMPGMDGLDVLRELRLEDKNIPVLLMTGDDPGWARRSHEQYGASGFLSKALGAEKLVSQVEEIILESES